MTSFSNACEVKDSFQLVIEGPGIKGAELRRFPQPFAVIGRDPRADLLLDHPKVSRRHAYLQVVGGWVFWIDLESRTGTRTEAGPQSQGWLAEGQSLRFGPYVIRRAVEADRSGVAAVPGAPPVDSPLAAQSYGRHPLPEVALEFLNGPSQSMYWPMRRVMSLIGSAKGCKFRLTDPSVSAFHASLLRTPAGLWLVDLRGGQSLTVNAVPVRSSLLVDGDVLGIGRYRVRARCRIRGRGSAHTTAEVGRSSLIGRHPRRDRPALSPPPVAERAADALAPTPAPAPADPGMAAVSRALPILASAAGVEIPSSSLPILATVAGIEMMASSSEVASLAKANPSEWTESALAPLVNQFSMMQQQMFDQFQQAMGMLVQMFGTMHREQMDVIREELDRLHELSRELHALKTELANPTRRSAEPSGELVGDGAGLGPARPATRVPKLPPAPPPGADAATAPVSVRAPSHSDPGGPRPAPFNSSAALIPSLGPLAAAAGARDNLSPLAAASPSPAPFPAPLLSSRPIDPAPQPDRPRPGIGTREVPGDAATPGPGTDRDAVLWIHQRIMALQSERESRWQKILKLIPGAS